MRGMREHGKQHSWWARLDECLPGTPDVRIASRPVLGSTSLCLAFDLSREPDRSS